jgi:hypothetical protein
MDCYYSSFYVEPRCMRLTEANMDLPSPDDCYNAASSAACEEMVRRESMNALSSTKTVLYTLLLGKRTHDTQKLVKIKSPLILGQCIVCTYILTKIFNFEKLTWKAVLNSLHWEVRAGKTGSFSWNQLRAALYLWKDIWDESTKNLSEEEWNHQGYRKICLPEMWWVTMLLIEVEVVQTLSILPVPGIDAPPANDINIIHEILKELNDLTI